MVHARTDDVSAHGDTPPWEELVWQEARQSIARRLNIPVAAVRPCFARIGIAEEGSRNNTSFVYATELRRMGVAEATAWAELVRWNGMCKPPLPERELRAAFESAWNGQKAYGCRGLLAALWCIGRERCDWHAKNMARRRKCRESDFLDFGWPVLLKSAEMRTYLALTRLEQLRGVGAGGLVAAGMRDYAYLGGVDRRWVPAALEGLERWGLLLVVEKGEKRQAGLPSRACQVKRVVPIPEPPVALANRRRAALCD